MGIQAVIGGSGFLGTVLVSQLLETGANVRIIDTAPSPRFPELVHQADMRDRAQLKAALDGVDLVYNLAAEWRDDVRPLDRYFSVNVGGAEAFCDVASELGIRRCVFTSSVSVYGTSDVEIGEDAPKHPFNAYGRSKLDAEAVFVEWARHNPDVMLSIVRPTVIFGPGNRGNVYNLLDQIRRRSFVMVGNGENRKSIAFVENVAAFHRHVSDVAPGLHIYNYADKPDFSMNELVSLVERELGIGDRKTPRLPYAAAYAIGKGFDLLARLSGRRFPVSAERVFKFCANTRYSAGAARASGFEPPVELGEALRRTIRADIARST